MKVLQLYQPVCTVIFSPKLIDRSEEYVFQQNKKLRITKVTNYKKQKLQVYLTLQDKKLKLTSRRAKF